MRALPWLKLGKAQRLSRMEIKGALAEQPTAVDIEAFLLCQPQSQRTPTLGELAHCCWARNRAIGGTIRISVP